MGVVVLGFRREATCDAIGFRQGPTTDPRRKGGGLARACYCGGQRHAAWAAAFAAVGACLSRQESKEGSIPYVIALQTRQEWKLCSARGGNRTTGVQQEFVVCGGGHRRARSVSSHFRLCRICLCVWLSLRTSRQESLCCYLILESLFAGVLVLQNVLFVCMTFFPLCFMGSCSLWYGL